MTTFSTALKLELPGDGQQSGTWGQTTNKNLGTLIEQAITGVQSITMFDADYTLTNLNGVSDEARNAVIRVSGTNSAIRDVIAPLVNKCYLISNNTAGGYAIRIRGASGYAVTVPNGASFFVYCDSTNFYASVNGTAGTFSVNGNLNITGTTAANAITCTTVSGTTITASSQFDGPGTGLTGTAAALSIGGNAVYANTAGTADALNSANNYSVANLNASGTVQGVYLAAGENTNATGLITLLSSGYTGYIGADSYGVGIGASSGARGAYFYNSGGSLGAFDSTGMLYSNSGFGSIFYTYGCRAWVKFTGNGDIYNSGNVGSVTHLATGRWNVNFSTAMPDANYTISGIAGASGYYLIGNTMSASYCYVASYYAGGPVDYFDNDPVCVVIHR